MSEAIQLLNHGFVRLVDHMGNDLSVVRSARVSYDAEWRTGEDEGKDAKLISYLMKNRHCVVPSTKILTRDLRWVAALLILITGIAQMKIIVDGMLGQKMLLSESQLEFIFRAMRLRH